MRIHHSHIQYHLRFLYVSRHFRIKGTIHYPACSEKRGQKPRKGHYIVPFIRCPYTQRDQYIAPQIRFPRINGATKGIIICPSYYLSVSERDNILSPLCTVYLRERDNIISPSFSPRFPTYFTRGTIYCPPQHISRHLPERDNNMSLLYAFLLISGIIYCPLYTQFSPTFPLAYSPKGTIYCPSHQNKAEQKGQLIVPFTKRFPTNAPYIVPFICRFRFKHIHPTSAFLSFISQFICGRNNTGSKITPLLLPQTIPGEAMTGYGRRNSWRTTNRTYVRIKNINFCAEICAIIHLCYNIYRN